MTQEIGGGTKPGKLFLGSCIGLIATAMSFAVMGAIMNPLKADFLLSNTQVGWIGGAQLWGFPISIMIFGPLCSTLGMRFLMRLAFLCHSAGVLLMIFANGFWMLFFGALTIALGNGLIEGACNPLVATLYPDRKTEKLNNFHVWFPGGIVIGGVICWMLSHDKLNLAASLPAGLAIWQLELACILIPTFIYGTMMFFAKYPRTEAAESGMTIGGMFMASITRPLFLMLFICMMMTASVELGPNRWIPSILEKGALPGILVLVYINGLMAVLRQLAGPIVGKFSPTGVLVGSAFLAGVGLFTLSFTPINFLVLIPATIFAVGVCYFWPTMLGVVAERVPKGGEFALAMMGTAGNIGVGLIAIPLMGFICDYYGHEKLDYAEVRPVIEQAAQALPVLENEDAVKNDAKLYDLTVETDGLVKEVLAAADSSQSLLRVTTAKALRGASTVAPDSAYGSKAGELLAPADLYGGRIAFRYISGLTVILFLVFGGLFLSDRAKGGYKVEKIEAQAKG